MGVRIEKPRSDNYNLFLAALDRYGNYSEPLEFTINHPGIQQLELSSQDVTGLIGSIKINLPKVYTQRSQEVYPEKVANEEKEILGYRIHLQEVDYNTEEPIGEEEIIDYDAQEINEKGIIYYQTETGKKFEIKVGAYDSVYHPDFNPDLYEQTVSQTIINSTMKIERPDISEALIKPNDLTTTLQGAGLTADDFGEGGIESTYTIQAGVWDDINNEPVVGGIGLAYNEDENDIDVQIVADRFRLFDPDVDPNGSAIFAAGTVDGKSQIFLNANEIALTANDGNTEYTDGNFFVLNDDNLRIYTDDFKLNKGNATFSGEVQANQFSLTSGDMVINTDGINSPNFNLNANTGDATFSGELQAATGRLGDDTHYIDFDGSTLDIKTTEFDYTEGSTNVNMNSEGVNITTETFNLGKDGNISIFGKKNIEIVANDEEGYIKLEDEQGNYTILDENHLRFYEEGLDDPVWYSKRVIYGTVPSGTYIDLTNSNNEVTWETTPKVQTAISSIQTYYPNEADSDIYYECYAAEKTREGFRVYGEAYAPIGEGSGFNESYSSDWRFSDEYIIPNYTTNSNTTKLDVWVNVGQRLNGYYVYKWSLNIEYRKVGDTTWNTMGSFNGGGYTQSTYYDGTIYTEISTSKIQLPPSDYEIRLNLSGMARVFLEINDFYYDYIEQGDVFYIAIEGGQF